MLNIRIGYGIDFHKLVEGKPFILGGIEIPHHKGAEGHSDADVLIHAICDAMLGALALGDIGYHFPDTDAKYKGIDSKVLLKRCNHLIKEKGYYIVNIDATVCLQTPKISIYKERMQLAIGETLGISKSEISIKATTTEEMGFVGREEGVQAHAIVLLSKY